MATNFRLEERDADTYDDVDLAQRASLETVAAAVARAVRVGLDDGRFCVIDGLVQICNQQPASVE